MVVAGIPLFLCSTQCNPASEFPRALLGLERLEFHGVGAALSMRSVATLEYLVMVWLLVSCCRDKVIHTLVRFDVNLQFS